MLQVQQLLTQTEHCISDGSNGGKASNYKITFIIWQSRLHRNSKPVDLDGSKVYDGTNTVFASELSVVPSTLIGSEQQL